MQFIFFISFQRDIFHVFQAFDTSATDTQLLKTLKKNNSAYKKAKNNVKDMDTWIIQNLIKVSRKIQLTVHIVLHNRAATLKHHMISQEQ